MTGASSEDGDRSARRTTRSAGLTASQHVILCEEKKENEAVSVVAFNLTGEKWNGGMERRCRRRIPVRTGEGREGEERFADIFPDRSL